MDKLKIAIIGAGVSGMTCALECERLGVTADVYERHHSVGWIWPSVSTWPEIFTRRYGSDPLKYLKETYGINLKAAEDERVFIMKSRNAEARVEGRLGISHFRGKEEGSVERQLLRELRKTPIFYNSLANYKELAQKYDYVVVSSGRDFEAKELGVWEEFGRIATEGAIALGTFNRYVSTAYFNTDYAGTGFARLSPFSESEAILGLYVIDKGSFETQQLDINRRFEKFMEVEKLDRLELMYRVIIPPYSTGRVTRFQSGNILLAGRAAGLTDRLLGTGAIECMISGVLAARAMIKGEDYSLAMKPIQEHIENISAFRTHMKNFSNDDFDRMVSLLATPAVTQLVYHSQLKLSDLAGHILKGLAP